MTELTHRIRIGTCGWSYPAWRGPFYPAGLPADALLGFYATRFDTVEIDSTFYGLPAAASVAPWRAAVPAGFTFAVKANRFITHMKKLREPNQTLPPFLERVAPLSRALGVLLFQLPPHWKPDVERLDAFLHALGTGRRCAFELRDRRWWNDAVLDALRRHGCAVCIDDFDGALTPLEVTAPFVYVRLHGPRTAYQGSYGRRTLARWAERLRDWAGAGLDAYCYFDNDQAANAPRNAASLRAMVAGADAGAASPA